MNIVMLCNLGMSTGMMVKKLELKQLREIWRLLFTHILW